MAIQTITNFSSQSAESVLYALEGSFSTAVTRGNSLASLLINTNVYQRVSRTVVGQQFISFYFRINQLPASGYQEFFSFRSASWSGNLMGFSVSSLGEIAIYNVPQGSGYAIVPDTWYRFSLRIGASGIKLKLDDLLLREDSGNYSLTGNFGLGTSSGIVTAGTNMYYSDLIVGDDGYDLDEDYYVNSVFPSSNGAYDQWPGNYSSVDEAPLSTADFISSTLVSGQRESFLGDFSSCFYTKIHAIKYHAYMASSSSRGGAAYELYFSIGGVEYPTGIWGITGGWRGVGYMLLPPSQLFIEDVTGMEWGVTERGTRVCYMAQTCLYILTTYENLVTEKRGPAAQIMG